MSKIDGKLKEAEAERQRVVAERKEREAADEHERAGRERADVEAAARAAAQGRAADEIEAERLATERRKAEPRKNRMAAAFAMAAAVAAASWIGTLTTREPRPAPKAVPAAPIAKSGALPLKLHDLDAFAARIPQK